MTRAILLMLIGMSLIPAGDAANKILTTDFGAAPLFVSWSRFLVGTLCILPFMYYGGWGIFRDPWIWLRGGLIAAGISAISIALQTTDIATAFGGMFIAPIVSFITAALFLREPVTVLRLILIITGFAGVLLVAQPGLNFTVGAGFSLLAGVFYGCFLTLSRKVAVNYPPLPLLFSQMAVAVTLLTPLGVTEVPTFDTQITKYVLLSGLFSMAGNLLLIMAYSLAPATRLAPLVYFQLIAALTIGWLVFATLPNMLALIGLFVIAASGFATFILKR